MKKLFGILVVVATMVAFVSCGPNQEQLKQKAFDDSVRVADSLSLVKQYADSVVLKFKNDSIAKDDSIAKITTKKVKK